VRGAVAVNVMARMRDWRGQTKRLSRVAGLHGRGLGLGREFGRRASGGRGSGTTLGQRQATGEKRQATGC
jgi:hypothetical protein